MIQVTEAMRQAFKSDGAIKAEGLLSAAELAECRRCVDFNLANPGPTALELYAGTIDAHYNDLGTAKSREVYRPMLQNLRFAEFLAALWGSEHVWFFGEEIFIKDGGEVGRPLWHQDTPYIPADGAQMANIWISFEALPARNALEVVKGSHLGPMYDGAAFMDSMDPTRPVWDVEHFPRLPDIEAERAMNPTSWDMLSWALAPGDAVVLHSGALHGGAPVDAACPIRHTVVLRFFGDDLRYRPLPDVKPDYFMDLRAFNLGSLEAGDVYRDKHFLQLR